MTSTFTPSLNLEVPARGDYLNDWDLPANSNYTAIDSGVGGVANVALTTGVVNLTQAQANCAIISFSGTLTGNVTVLYPATSSGRKICFPGFTPGAFTVTIRGGGGSDTVGILLTFGQFGAPVTSFLVMPSRVYWDYTGTAGPGSLIGYPTATVMNGWIPCDGRLISTTQFDLLFDLLGYSFGGSGASFGVPDYRGYAMVGSDSMGTAAGSAGRFFNFGPGGITGAVNVVPALASHAHNISSVDPGHAHSASQPAHSHSGVITGFSVGGSFGAAAGWALNTGTTGLAQPGVTVNGAGTGIVNTAAAGAGGASSVVQPSRTINVYVKT
jgi:microcystin-dependent protein